MTTKRFTAQEMFDAVAADPRVKAYPRLVEALREVIASPNIEKCPGGLWSTADDTEYRKAERARALLAELGE